jgi:hypothetical protein
VRRQRLAIRIALAVAVVAILWFRSADREAAAGPAGSGAPSPSGASSASYDLAPDEARGGHTLERHVGRNDDELRRRLEEEAGISAASSFTDRSTAERVVAATLERERRRVDRWLADGRGNLALDYRGAPGEIVGRTLPRGAASPKPTGDARVVLAKSGSTFRVVTAYPLGPR